jgi:hypothetical protein
LALEGTLEVRISRSTSKNENENDDEDEDDCQERVFEDRDTRLRWSGSAHRNLLRSSLLIPSFLKIVLVLVVVLVLVLQALPVQRGSRSKETGAKHKLRSRATGVACPYSAGR